MLDHPVAVAVDEGNGMGKTGTVEVYSCTQEHIQNQVPDLREEYPDFSLVHIMPEQIYEEKAGDRVSGEAYYQIKAVSDEAVPSWKKA